MSDMLFDTQKMVERLEGAGVPPVQARVHTAVLAEVTNAMEAAIIERCASKQDLEKLEARIDVRLAESKGETIRWVVTVGILQTALIAALMLKLAP